MTAIWLSGNPRPAPRPRGSGNGQSFNPRWYTDLKKRWAQEAALQLLTAPTFFDGQRLAVSLMVYRADNRVADWDNLSKSATDPLSGIWWGDDAQIDEAHVYVMRGVGSDAAGVQVAAWECGRKYSYVPIDEANWVGV